MRLLPATRRALARLGVDPREVWMRGLVEQAEARELEFVGFGPGGRLHFLAPPAARAWHRLRTAAVSDGVELHLVSAFRSIDRQVFLVQRRLARGEPVAVALSVVAPPGFSEHHTGCAIDIGTPDSPPLEIGFEGTAAFRWLRSHGVRFGFVLSYPPGNASGYAYEPWHWCYHGS